METQQQNIFKWSERDFDCLCGLKGSLELELNKKRRIKKGQPSAYARSKQIYKLKGSRAKVYEQIRAFWMEAMLERNMVPNS